jgi:DNA-directed RNA polymerase subunit K/omega
VESLEERIKTLTEQLETQYELHKTAAHRARKAESDLLSYDERLRSAEGELAAGDVLRDEFKTDKEKVRVRKVVYSLCFNVSFVNYSKARLLQTFRVSINNLL